MLSSGLIQNFGFLKTPTHGLPDLVIWSHDSAQRTPGFLWKFDGENYAQKCTGVLAIDKQLPDGSFLDSEVHLEADSCKGLDVQEQNK